MGRTEENAKRPTWPRLDVIRSTVDLHVLPPVEAIDGARIRELTGDLRFPDTAQVSLRAFCGIVGDRTFHVGFCLGNETGFSAIGIAVIERLMMETHRAPLHVVLVHHEDIAWDIVLRHLRTYAGRILLFAFPNSDVYDAGPAEINYSRDIRVFDEAGAQVERLSEAQRHKIREQKAKTLRRPPPEFYPAAGVDRADVPWIFRFVTPTGKTVRAAVWNGRRDYAHEFPEDILRWVGGEKIAVVQVDSPVGVDRRSSIDLTHKLTKDFDGVIHWARDTPTFQSIIMSFVRLDLQSIAPPPLPDDWSPEVTILAANT